jgi:hypothetical protein
MVSKTKALRCGFCIGCGIDFTKSDGTSAVREETALKKWRFAGSILREEAGRFELTEEMRAERTEGIRAGSRGGNNFRISDKKRGL